MAFSLAQYEAVIDQINSGLTTFEGNLAKIKPAATKRPHIGGSTRYPGNRSNWIADKTAEFRAGGQVISGRG